MQFSQCNTVFLIGHGIVGSEEIMLSDCQTSDFRVQQARLNRCCVRSFRNLRTNSFYQTVEDFNTAEYAMIDFFCIAQHDICVHIGHKL